MVPRIPPRFPRAAAAHGASLRSAAPGQEGCQRRRRPRSDRGRLERSQRKPDEPEAAQQTLEAPPGGVRFGIRLEARELLRSWGEPCHAGAEQHAMQLGEIARDLFASLRRARRATPGLPRFVRAPGEAAAVARGGRQLAAGERAPLRAPAGEHLDGGGERGGRVDSLLELPREMMPQARGLRRSEPAHRPPRRSRVPPDGADRRTARDRPIPDRASNHDGSGASTPRRRTSTRC